MLELVLIALAGGVSMGVPVWRGYSRLQLWRLAAKASGLQIEKSGDAWPWPREIKARLGPLKVSIGKSVDSYSLIVIDVPGPPGFQEVSIGRQPRVQAPAQEIASGDPLLDRELFLAGPLQLVRALLDAETRQLLLKVGYLGRLEIVHGQVRGVMDTPATLNLLPILLAIGQRLARPLDVVQRLTDNAREDPEAGVRLQNLLLLARELPGAKTLEALRAACSDKAPFIRLRAAEELGAEGRGIVEAFAESPEEDALSAEAVSFLGRDLPFERTRALLDQAVSSRLHQTALACLKALGLSGDAADVEALAKVLEQEDGELAIAAAQALEATGSPAAEPALILALQREPMAVQVAAADALGRVGSPAAVLPLKEAAESFHFAKDLRKAARQAIAAIQSRLPGASPGQLSLAGGDIGNLSLAQTEGGELSLAGDPAGQLDLTEGEEG